ncbi:MAG: BT4734/BF3469 family protein [Ferruginibacter sp.]
MHQLVKGTGRYDEIKASLPCVKPHGTFNGYADKNNFKQFSGYIFFDIDKGNIDRAKESLIKNYSDKICMLGKSVGGAGLFFYVKISNAGKVNADNFLNVQNYLINKVFKEFKIDNNAKGINRNQVIPYDNELLEFDGQITIPNSIFENKDVSKKCATSCNNKSTKENVYTTTCTFLDIKDLKDAIVWKTKFDIGDKDYVVEDYEQARIYIPKVIVDGNKHKTFKAMVHSAVFNNVAITYEQIVSFIHYINQNHTGGQPMKQQEMIYTVKTEFEKIKTTGEILHTKTRHVKTNPKLDKVTRQRLGAKGVGEWKQKESIRLIQIAIKEIKSAGVKPTIEIVTEYMKDRKFKRSKRTITKYWREVIPKVVEETKMVYIGANDKHIEQEIPELNLTIYSIQYFIEQFKVNKDEAIEMYEGQFEAIKKLKIA